MLAVEYGPHGQVAMDEQQRHDVVVAILTTYTQPFGFTVIPYWRSHAQCGIAIAVNNVWLCPST